MGSLVRTWPQHASTVTEDGTRFRDCDLNQYMYRALFVYGAYEFDVGWMVRRVLRPGDTVIDAGACFGYHALSAAKRIAPGRVYAIEPQPKMFAAMTENVARNPLTNIETENLALSDHAETLQLHIFPGLDPGCTSIATLDRCDFETIECPAISLDEYIQRKGIGEVTLIKLDVEGSEMQVLKGAHKLLSSPRPPMWIIEINQETSQACGYNPEGLLSLLKRYGYSFYRPVWGKLLRKIRGLQKCENAVHGENILCAIEGVHGERFASAVLTA
ncbi:MAG: FkbM family methyltransferase [Terriglobales bacterium]